MSRPPPIAAGLSQALIDWPDTGNEGRRARLSRSARPRTCTSRSAGRSRRSDLPRATRCLDRHAGEFLGDRDRLVDVILGAALPSEAAAEVMAIDLALRERQTRGRRQRRQRRLETLRRRPALRLVGGETHRGVVHLHAGMGEERRRIGRLDLLRRAGDRRQGIALAPLAIGLGRGQAALEMLGDRLRSTRWRSRRRPIRPRRRRARSSPATRCRRPRRWPRPRPGRPCGRRASWRPSRRPRS